MIRELLPRDNQDENYLRVAANLMGLRSGGTKTGCMVSSVHGGFGLQRGDPLAELAVEFGARRSIPAPSPPPTARSPAAKKFSAQKFKPKNRARKAGARADRSLFAPPPGGWRGSSKPESLWGVPEAARARIASLATPLRDSVYATPCHSDIATRGRVYPAIILATAAAA
jgi:hypothetical protein